MLLVLTALVLTACPSPAPAKNVSVTATGADAAAYRVGSGSWQVPDDVTSFAFTATGAYEVAVRCGDDTTVWSLTKADTETPDLSCPPAAASPIAFDVTFDVTSVAGAVEAALYYGDNAMTAGTTAGTFNVTDGSTGEQDLVLVALDGSGTPIAADMLTVNVTAGGSYSITLAAGDTANVISGSIADFSAQVPAGWPTAGAMMLTITPKGTGVMGGILGSSGGSFTSFAFSDHDLAFVMASDGSGVQNLIHLATSTTPGASFTADLPAPFSVTVSSDTFPTISGLSVSDPQLRMYGITMSWATKTLSAMVSTGFLASATSYTLPDLTGLTGFTGFAPASGDTVSVNSSAFYSSLTTSEMFDLSTEDSLFGLPAGESARIAGDRDTYTAP
ncbi:hypothetical protein [Oceanithermus desulfurans]|uniref:Uncharacterized protein n=2 Tax=Oceanithermus desulfurans TaxID=227924 RepID=A0A511RME5_9DEIN|nr:hypothetical protein [Oceanithermus desulfurans]MBB6030886.1 hypothetical protein [Oceanithermus desulfurans]GEM90820.1 hypothetical protein ODE01S_22540 [Oceanithermus desulfurans NBRC 100063]